MFATSPLAARPLMSGPRVPRAFRVAAVVGEYGFAAWAYSRQAKLNAWTWHGIGALGNVNSWASLGNVVYLRNDSDDFMYAIQPDVFLAESDTNAESDSVQATTQWLDMGKPTKLKALTGIDADCQNIESIEVYVAIDGDREGTLADTILIDQNNSGWTYAGEIIPVNAASTEFKLKFIGHGNLEAQINRITLHFDELAG